MTDKGAFAIAAAIVLAALLHAVRYETVQLDKYRFVRTHALTGAMLECEVGGCEAPRMR